MRTFHSRQLLETPREKWPCLEKEKFNLVFEDGETLVTNTTRTEISVWLWVALEHYPKTKISVRHHIGEGPLSQNRIQSVLSEITRDIHLAYGELGYDREKLWYYNYKAHNRLYNKSIVEYAAYVRSVNSMHFSELYDYPPLAKIRESMRPDSLSIEKANKLASDLIMTDPNISRNPIVSDMRAGLIRMEQLLQIILVRGFNTDIDDYIYKHPIMGNYFAGITDPAEAMMDSTLAAKSIISQGQPLEQTEYANRKMQFTSMRMDLLVMRDCGHNELSKIEVTANRFKDMEGLNYLDRSTGKLRAIRAEDKHLIGETLEFRLPFNCGFRHYGSVCKVCYGDLAYNIPRGANIGWIASTMTMSEVSQRVLKIKHSESSTVAEPIKINYGEMAYIRVGSVPNQICLNENLAKQNITLLLRAAVKDRAFNASRLPVLKLKDIGEGFSPAKHSQFREVTFEHPAVDDKKQPSRYHVSVSRGARMSYLTNDFLKYIIENKFRVREDGFYHILLDGWDFSKPVFELPNKHMSMRDFAAEVEVFIRSTRDKSSRHLGQLKQLRQYEDPVEALLDMHELISSKVAVHFTHCAVVMASMMVSATDPKNPFIPKLGEPTRFAKYDQVMNSGSLGALFAYQGGREALDDIEQYMNTNRPQHLLDPILMPV